MEFKEFGYNIEHTRGVGKCFHVVHISHKAQILLRYTHQCCVCVCVGGGGGGGGITKPNFG